ncbi:MAG: hypothetical protein IPM91_18860 [Bacteroidetes bacterium]|nr:hypothetical protein [Bacteroidota bacterium]
MKGFDAQFDPSFFKEKLVEGTLPTLNDSTYTTAILLSQNLANKLRLKTGDSFLLFFIQEDRKVRKLKISGIYKYRAQ